MKPLHELYLKACESGELWLQGVINTECAPILRDMISRTKAAEMARNVVEVDRTERKPLDAKVADLIRACEQDGGVDFPVRDALAALRKEVEGE